MVSGKKSFLTSIRSIKYWCLFLSFCVQSVWMFRSSASSRVIKTRSFFSGSALMSTVKKLTRSSNVLNSLSLLTVDTPFLHILLNEEIVKSPSLIERYEIYQRKDKTNTDYSTWILSYKPIELTDLIQKSIPNKYEHSIAVRSFVPINLTADYWRENFHFPNSLKKHLNENLLKLTSSSGGIQPSSNGLKVFHTFINIKQDLSELTFLQSFYQYYQSTQIKDLGLYRITLYRDVNDPNSFLVQSIFHQSDLYQKHILSPSYKTWKELLDQIPSDSIQTTEYESVFPAPILFHTSSHLSLTPGEGGRNDVIDQAVKAISSANNPINDNFSGWKGLSTAVPGMFSFQGPKIVMGRNIAQSAVLSTLLTVKAQRPLIVTGRTGATRYKALLDQVFNEKNFPNYRYEDNISVIEGEPTVEDVIAARDFAVARNADCVLAIGGGSTMDLGKAVAALIPNAHRDIFDFLEVVGKGLPLEKDPLPFIAVPTTSGTGSEATKNAVVKSVKHGRKVSIRHDKMFAVAAIIDPMLTLSCPPSVTAHVGMDTLCQVIEPYICNAPTPFVDALAREGIIRASRSLRNAVWNGAEDIEAREDMAIASVFSGLSLANARLGVVHGFAAVLGGMFEDAPHGAICASLLPSVFAKNAQALQRVIDSPQSTEKEKMEALQRLNRVLEVARLITNDPTATIEQGIDWLNVLLTDINIPPLSQLCKGMTKDDFPTIIAATHQASSSRGNPIKLNDKDLNDILLKSDRN